jgi:hypothetical protein
MKTVLGMSVGQTFGALKLVSTADATAENRYLCTFECLCGNKKNIVAPSVKYGSTKSCGCMKKEICKIHGLAKTKAYMAWQRSRVKGFYVDFDSFLRIYPEITEKDTQVTSIGVVSSKMSKMISNSGVAPFPFKYFCAFLCGFGGSDFACRSAGVSAGTASKNAREFMDLYELGMKARTERETASKPAPPSLPVNTSVDF